MFPATWELREIARTRTQTRPVTEYCMMLAPNAFQGSFHGWLWTEVGALGGVFSLGVEMESEVKVPFLPLALKPTE